MLAGIEARRARGSSDACSGAGVEVAGGSRPACRSAIVSPEMTEVSYSAARSPPSAASSRCLSNSHESSACVVFTKDHEPFMRSPRIVTEILPSAIYAAMRRLASA